MTAQASLQVADAIIVATDVRGYGIAKRLAERGWKTVVIELTGGPLNKELDWADRLGPFLAWESEGAEEVDGKGQAIRSNFPALWLSSGPVAFGGRTANAGAQHLSVRYGIDAQTGANPRLLEQGWPRALSRSLLSSRLKRRELFLDGNDLELPWSLPVKDRVNAEAVARARREAAIGLGVRVLEAEQISAVRVSDGRIDRVEFKTSAGILTERTRSLVWMLSEEESRRVDYVGPDVPLESFFVPGKSEPLMAWWRNRLAVRGMKRANSRTLTRLPETPSHVVLVGLIERPWTHDNLAVLDIVEENAGLRVYDVWVRVPYWARADHVYRDEQRLLSQRLLADRLVACETVWASPSPLGLTEPAVRLPHVLYNDGLIAPKARLRNICFAGPETWPAVGLRGIAAMEDSWLANLEKMRIEWDPAARVKASRMERLRYAFRNIGGTGSKSDRNQEEAAP